MSAYATVCGQYARLVIGKCAILSSVDFGDHPMVVTALESVVVHRSEPSHNHCTQSLSETRNAPPCLHTRFISLKPGCAWCVACCAFACCGPGLCVHWCIRVCVCVVSCVCVCVRACFHACMHSCVCVVCVLCVCVCTHAVVYVYVRARVHA